MSSEKVKDTQVSKEVEYIQICLDESSERVPLAKVQKILRAYQEDLWDYNGKLEKKRLGKILTIINGAIADQTQRKAIKDIVNDVWYGEHYVEGHSHYPRLEQATQAIGFDLWDKNAVPMNTQQIEEYNKYKEL